MCVCFNRTTRLVERGKHSKPTTSCWNGCGGESPTRKRKGVRFYVGGARSFRKIGFVGGWCDGMMEFWPEFLASGWGREFVAGGLGGMAGVISGHPLDTLRIRLQQPGPGTTAFGLLKSMVTMEGPVALYRGMAAPLVSVAFQNAVVFQVYALLSRSLEPKKRDEPPSFRSVALAGLGTGALQSLTLCPVDLVKIRLQLQSTTRVQHGEGFHRGPMDVAKNVLRKEGVRGIYRGLSVTVLRDAPAHGAYFWTYEYVRERLHPGCRKGESESLATMLTAGGLAGVTSWVCCYPLDVVKSRIQAHTPPKYGGVVDCLRRSVVEEGPRVLWRGMGTAVARAFVVNGAIFSAYEVGLRLLFADDGGIRIPMDEASQSP